MKNKLLRAIQRSEFAYSAYLKNKRYFQAIRIYNANKVVYGLLEEFLFLCEEKDIEIVCNYLFHLEDWFNQFENKNKEEKMELSSEFVFERLENAVPFPKDFKDKLL